MREAAGSYSMESVKTLVNIMRNRRASHATRIAAASAILDRAVGKPSVPPATRFADGSTLPVIDATSLTPLDVARRIAFALELGMRALNGLPSDPGRTDAPALPSPDDDDGEPE